MTGLQKFKFLLPDDRRGMTLVELLVSMLLSILVLVGVVSLFASSNQAYVSQDLTLNAEQNIRASLEVITHEIRMAGYIALDNLTGGTNPISTDLAADWDGDGSNDHDGNLDQLEGAGSNYIAFAADINVDDQTDLVWYYLAGTDLMRQSWQWNGAAWQLQGGGPALVTENITALNFTYTFEDGDVGVPDETDGDASNDLEAVRYVLITITGRTANEVRKGVAFGGKEYKYRTLKSFVRLRNMGLDTSSW